MALTPLIEWIRVGDPDRSRWRLALRATVAVGVALLLLSAAPFVPITARMLGASMALMASIAVTDPDRRGQWLTYAVLPIPVAASLAIGTWSAQLGVLGWGLFVAVIFFSVVLQTFGRRGTACGIVAFNASFFALFFEASAAELPLLIGGALFGVAIAAVLRMWGLPDHPRRSLKAAARALPSALSQLLGLLARVVERPDTGGAVLRVRRRIQTANEIALTIDELAGDAPVSERAFELEVYAGRIVAGARDLIELKALTPEVRAGVAAALRALRSLLQGAGSLDQLERCCAALEGLSGPPEVALVASRLALALEDAARTAISLREVSLLPGAARVRPARTPEPLLRRLRGPTLNQALQAAAACALAIAVGRWISPERWFWAVLTAYLVIAPATTRGDILVRAWRRSLGTVVGVAVGMLVAAVVHAPELELALIFAFIFLGVRALRTSYTVMVMWFTALLAMLYALIGQYSPELLYVRIAETVAGAAIGATTAALLLPRRTGHQVRTVLVQFLSQAEQVFSELGAAAAQRAPLTLETLRALDRALRELRSAADPLTRGRLPIARETLDAVHAAAALAFYCRQLATPGLIATTEGLVDDAQRLAARTGALVETLSGKEVTVPPAPPGLQATDITALWIHRIDQQLSQLATLAARAG